MSYKDFLILCNYCGRSVLYQKSWRDTHGSGLTICSERCLKEVQKQYAGIITTK